MSTSLVYRSAHGYELLMRSLYGRHYTQRMAAVAARVPAGSSVLELCCGPATLYLRHLKDRTSSYIAVDVNERFVARLRRRGIDARQLDLRDFGARLPDADVALMQASLYHFLPEADRIVERMLAAARESVIISEPIRNLASSDLPLVGRLGRKGTDPGVGGHAERFTEATLDALMGRYPVVEAFKIPGGREKGYVLAAREAAPPATPDPGPRPHHRSGTAGGP